MKFNAGADRAAAYAMDAVESAIAAMDEAAGPSVEAVLAPVDADTAVSF